MPLLTILYVPPDSTFPESGPGAILLPLQIVRCFERHPRMDTARPTRRKAIPCLFYHWPNPSVHLQVVESLVVGIPPLQVLITRYSLFLAGA